MLTPSSNTVLEPITVALSSALSGVSAHFSRFRVTQISLADDGLDQFALEPMLEASELLSHAKMDVITWNGTAAGWMGLGMDHTLIKAIKQRTGIGATTCVLAMVSALRELGAKKIGLVSPYTSDVQDRIVDNFSSLNLTVVAESHFGLCDNFSFSEVPRSSIERAIDEVANAGADAVIILCTNLDGAAAAAQAERRHGIPILDSVVVSLWGALRACGYPLEGLSEWSNALARLPLNQTKEASDEPNY